MTGQFPPAAVIFTALAVERSAVVAHLTHTDGVTDGQGIVYTVGDFDAGECKWKVAVAELGAGNAETAAAVSGAALFFDPRAMFFAGVAGGRKDVGIGDVVAGSTVLQIESGKEDAGGMLPRPRAVNASFRAEQLARAIATGGEWRARVGEKGDSSASAVVGAIGSGERVVADAEGETATRLAEMYSNVIAVEMEGYGFLTAMRRFPVVETIVVRGVSDLLSDKADADASGSQELAAANAAAFAFEVLAQLPCEEGPRPEPQFFAQELATAVAEAQPAEPIVVELRSTGLGQTRTQRDHEPRGLRGPQFLSTLRQDHPADAELIETEVGPAPSRETLADLALSPPDWLTAASDRVWEMLAQFADDLAEWPAATTLFQEAATRADAPDRRVLLLTRAAGSADLSGDTTLGEELLEHAVELNPAHPSVAFERARRESDPARRLAILESIEPDTPDRHAYFAAQRAIALLELGDLAAAKRAAAEATALNPDLPNVREASATVDLVEAGTLRRAGRPPDYDALGRAAETFLRLREDLISVHRWEESAAFLGRAVDALVFSARDADAAQLVQSARPEELEGAGGAHIALAALDALDFERAVELLHGRQDDDQTRVAYAAALLSRDHDEFRREGVSLLKAVLDHETSAYRSEAAWVLAGSMVYIGEFDEGLKALRHLEEVDSPRAALVRAQLVADEDPDAADTILLPHQSDLRVLRFRVAIATQAGNRDRALKLFDLFLKRERDPEVRLWRAEFLESVSETGASLTAYTEAARDATAPTHLRRVGYNRAARLAQSLHRYEDLSQLVREWRELEPDNRRLIVHEVAALVELARYADAEHVLADANFEPASQEEAALVGEVVYWTMEGEERLTRLIALSDRFDRAEPTLELKIGVLGASAHESVTEAVRERATRSLVEFAERFPESNAVAAVPGEQMWGTRAL
jgi:nucleoside phosphorylase